MIIEQPADYAGKERDMDNRVIKMNRNTWRIEDAGVRFFLLEGDKKALVIDSGMQITDAREIAEHLTDLPVELLNTHADRDHIACNEQFEFFYMHAGEEENYKRSGKKGTMILIEDGDVIDLGNRRLRIIHLPGHTAGSVAVLDEANRILISGDPVQAHGRIFMFGSHRNFDDYIHSLEKLNTMTDEFDELWPSHGDLPIGPEVIPNLLEGAYKIKNGEFKGKEEEFFGQKIIAYDLGFTVLLCDR